MMIKLQRPPKITFGEMVKREARKLGSAQSPLSPDADANDAEIMQETRDKMFKVSAIISRWEMVEERRNQPSVFEA